MAVAFRQEAGISGEPQFKPKRDIRIVRPEKYPSPATTESDPRTSPRREPDHPTQPLDNIRQFRLKEPAQPVPVFDTDTQTKLRRDALRYNGPSVQIDGHNLLLNSAFMQDQWKRHIAYRDTHRTQLVNIFTAYSS